MFSFVLFIDAARVLVWRCYDFGPARRLLLSKPMGEHRWTLSCPQQGILL